MWTHGQDKRAASHVPSNGESGFDSEGCFIKCNRMPPIHRQAVQSRDMIEATFVTFVDKATNCRVRTYTDRVISLKRRVSTTLYQLQMLFNFDSCLVGSL
jgi:hypothetical protein